MIRPPFLRKGDKIGIPAPAGKVSRDQVLPALDLFHKWGMEVELGENIFNTYNQYSATDEQRLSDFQRMLDDPSLKAIICARGGYGTVRIIDQLDFTKFIKYPKWIVGYSDITVLHSHINKNLGVETIHAVMPSGFLRSEDAVESLRRCLMGEEIVYSLDSHTLNRSGDAAAQLVGGNLSLLYSLSGSKSDIDTKGKILFIEDLNEYLYHLDRMMMNLKRSGKLNHLKGLIAGGFTDMKDGATTYGKAAEEIILEAVSEYNYPVCFNFPAGHIDKNLALVFGRKARFSVREDKSSLSFL